MPYMLPLNVELLILRTTLKQHPACSAFPFTLISMVTSVQFSSVQSLSHVQLFATPWITARQAYLSITYSWNLLKLMPIESVIPSIHLILCCPLLLLFPIPPSIRVFSNESTLHMRWPKYWSFSFSISPSNEHPGLISLRMDWLDLLAVQGTLKVSLPQTRWSTCFRTRQPWAQIPIQPLSSFDSGLIFWVVDPSSASTP